MSASIITTSRERKLGFRVLFLGMFAIGTGQTLFIAVLPPYARGLGLNTTEIGLIFSLSALGWMFMSPYWGRKSDYVGRKSIILLGLFIYSLTTILMGLEFKFHSEGFIGLTFLFILLIITRGFFGFLASGAHSASMAYVADRTTEKERSGVMALMGSAFAVSGIIGPALASQAILLGPLVPYFLFGSITGLIGILIWIFLPEKTKPNIRAKVLEVQLTAFDSRILTFISMGLFISQTQAIIMQLLAMYLQDKFDYTVVEATFYTGRVLILMGVTTFIVQFFIIRKISPTPGSLLRIGSIFSILSLLLFIFSTNLYYMSLALAIYGIGGALMGPGLFTGVSLAVGKNEQGAAAGILVSAYAAGFVINPFTGMKLFNLSPDFPYFLGIILMIFCLIISVLDKRLNRKVDFNEDMGHSGHTG